MDARSPMRLTRAGMSPFRVKRGSSPGWTSSPARRRPLGQLPPNVERQAHGRSSPVHSKHVDVASPPMQFKPLSELFSPPHASPPPSTSSRVRTQSPAGLMPAARSSGSPIQASPSSPGVGSYQALANDAFQSASNAPTMSDEEMQALEAAFDKLVPPNAEELDILLNGDRAAAQPPRLPSAARTSSADMDVDTIMANQDIFDSPPTGSRNFHSTKEDLTSPSRLFDLSEEEMKSLTVSPLRATGTTASHSSPPSQSVEQQLESIQQELAHHQSLLAATRSPSRLHSPSTQLVTTTSLGVNSLKQRADDLLQSVSIPHTTGSAGTSPLTHSAPSSTKDTFSASSELLDAMDNIRNFSTSLAADDDETAGSWARMAQDVPALSGTHVGLSFHPRAATPRRVSLDSALRVMKHNPRAISADLVAQPSTSSTHEDNHTSTSTVQQTEQTTDSSSATGGTAVSSSTTCQHCVELEEQLAQKDVQLINVTEDVKEYEARYNNILSEGNRLHAAYSVKCNMVRELLAQKQAVQGVCSSLEEENKSLSEDYNTLFEQFKSFVSANAQRESDISSLEDQVEQLQEKLKEATQKSRRSGLPMKKGTNLATGSAGGASATRKELAAAKQRIAELSRDCRILYKKNQRLLDARGTVQSIEFYETKCQQALNVCTLLSAQLMKEIRKGASGKVQAKQTSAQYAAELAKMDTSLLAAKPSASDKRQTELDLLVRNIAGAPKVLLPSARRLAHQPAQSTAADTTSSDDAPTKPNNDKSPQQKPPTQTNSAGAAQAQQQEQEQDQQQQQQQLEQKLQQQQLQWQHKEHELTAAVETATANAKELADQVEDLKAQLEAAHSEKKGIEHQRDQALQRVSELQRSVSDERSATSKHQAEMSTQWATERQQWQVRVNNAKREVDRLSNELDAALKEQQELSSFVHTQSKTSSALQEDLQQKLQATTKDLAATTKERNQLLLDVATAKDECRSLQETMEHMDQALTASRTELVELQQRTSKLANAVEEKEAELVKQETSFADALADQRSKLEMEVLQLRAALTRTQNTLQSLEQESTRNATAHELAAQQLTQRAEDAENTVKGMREAHNDAVQQYKTLKTEHQQTAAQLRKAELKMQSMENALQLATQERDSLRSGRGDHIRRMRREIEALGDENLQLKSVRSRLEGRLGVVEDALNAAQAELKATRAKLAKSKPTAPTSGGLSSADAERLKQQLVNSQQQLRQAHKELKQGQQNMKALQTTVSTTLKFCKARDPKGQAAVLEQYQRQLEECQTEIKRLHKFIEARKSQSEQQLAKVNYRLAGFRSALEGILKRSHEVCQMYGGQLRSLRNDDFDSLLDQWECLYTELFQSRQTTQTASQPSTGTSPAQ